MSDRSTAFNENEDGRPEANDGSGRANPQTRAERYVEQYQSLTQSVNDAGLMGRRRGFYWVMILGT
ncbi:hypothetical protein NL364_29765, partial [Klebsiella pneumoniae]|nr:hypothetical protein [Klebsiella pneumoniae]